MLMIMKISKADNEVLTISTVIITTRNFNIKNNKADDDG